MPLGHPHSHAHPHPHTHYPERNVVIALVANMLLCIAEAIIGVLAGSLALVADALHNTSDVASLGITLWARHIAHRPPDIKRTYGYVRAESIAAFVNLLALVVLGGFLGIESIQRIMEPTTPNGGTMMWMASLALIVNGATALVLFRESHGSMNMRAAFIHYLADAMASLAVILSGAIVYWWNIVWIDAVLSLAIALWISYQGIKELPAVINLLMQGAPSHLTLDEIDAAMCEVDGVRDVHHIHLWQLDDHMSALEAHIVLDDINYMDAVRVVMRHLLQERFHIHHATFEFESPATVCEHRITHHPHDAEILQDHPNAQSSSI